MSLTPVPSLSKSQNFPAFRLELTEDQTKALTFARDELRAEQTHDLAHKRLQDISFDMNKWNCGSAACIGGTIDIGYRLGLSPISSISFVGDTPGDGDSVNMLLFYASHDFNAIWLDHIKLHHALAMLDKLLETGVCDWAWAMEVQP